MTHIVLEDKKGVAPTPSKPSKPISNPPKQEPADDVEEPSRPIDRVPTKPTPKPSPSPNNTDDDNDKEPEVKNPVVVPIVPSQPLDPVSPNRPAPSSGQGSGGGSFIPPYSGSHAEPKLTSNFLALLVTTLSLIGFNVVL